MLLGGPTGVPANVPDNTFESENIGVPGKSGKDLWKTAKVKVPPEHAYSVRAVLSSFWRLVAYLQSLPVNNLCAKYST